MEAWIFNILYRSGITSTHSQSCTSTCVVPRRGFETCPGTYASGGQNGNIAWLEKRACLARGMQQATGSAIGKNISKVYQSGLSSENLFRHEGHRVSGLTHGDDFVVTGPTNRVADLRNNTARSVPNRQQKSSVVGQQRASKR